MTLARVDLRTFKSTNDFLFSAFSLLPNYGLKSRPIPVHITLSAHTATIFFRDTKSANMLKISVHLVRYSQNIDFTDISVDIFKISVEMDCDGVIVKNPNFL